MTRNNYITACPKGDYNANWRVDIGDVTPVANMAVNLTPPDPAADFNGDTRGVIVSTGQLRKSKGESVSGAEWRRVSRAGVQRKRTVPADIHGASTNRIIY